MKVAAVLLHNNRLYRKVFDLGDEISFGSHKKDDVIVPDFTRQQIVIEYKKSGISLNAKEAYQITMKSVSMEKMILLNRQDQTCILFTQLTDRSSKSLKLPYQGIFTLGRRTNDNDIVINMPFVSGRHLTIKCEAGNVRIEDAGSTNGIYFNGRRVDIARMTAGDVISILSVNIILQNNELFFEGVGDNLVIRKTGEERNKPLSVLPENSDKGLHYHKSPRMQEQLPSEPIVLSNPPSKGQKYEKTRGMSSMLLGTGAMAGASMLTGVVSPALVAARSASMVSPVANVSNNARINKRRKKSLEEYIRERAEKYGAYIEDQKARIDSVADVQRRILNVENPTPSECIKTVFKLQRNLWERMPNDRDFLDVRVGMGYEDLCVEVKTRADANGFKMEDDEAEELCEQIVEETRIVDNIPRRIPLLKYNSVGFIGPRDRTTSVVRNMLISLSVTHSFENVRIIGLFDEDERETWSALKWLPHIWDTDMESRHIAFNSEAAEPILEFLVDLLQMRTRDLSDSNNQGPLPDPYYIVIFGSKKLIEKNMIMNYLFSNNPYVGVTSLFLFDDIYQLPPECRYIVDLVDMPCCYERDKANEKKFFTMDQDVSVSKFEGFSRRMSAIKLEGFATKSALPKSLTFLEGYGVQTVEELNILSRWEQAESFRTLGAPIGKLAGDITFYLDIHEKAHGPHGLVAGTTGSGKSELLQTWILSMACTYHPFDVSFVLIDYKGGGMANLLEPLPHVVGKITNIGSNINRSMVSLMSELKRRQVIFDKYGVNHIDKYQKLFKQKVADEPLPHLIIVADEFAELKKEEPDFMAGLIRAARIGRSLGVHLVLATQKPGGVVDDQIQSNSRFRLCLKVQDTVDSREMIKRPDAAYIRQAGRAYIRVGEDEYFGIFQSYWSGAPYFGHQNVIKQEENVVRLVSTNGKRINPLEDKMKKKKSDIDEISAITGYIAALAKGAGIPAVKGPWLPELPEKLQISDLNLNMGFNGSTWEGKMRWLCVPVGMYDLPANQEQGVQLLDFAQNGHHAVYGAPGTGKTTFLKTMITSLCTFYTPEDVNIYVIDCGGWGLSVFDNMPHVGGIALDCEEEKVTKLSKMILDEFDKRKRLFVQNAVSSLVAYRESVDAKLPAVILVIDNIVPIFEMYPDLESFLLKVASEGTTYGIYMVYTSNSTTGVRYKIVQNMKGAVAFDLTDRGDFANTVGRLTSDMSLPKVMGRAYAKSNPPIEFQTALYADGETDRDMTNSIKKLSETMNHRWTGRRPEPIPVMPDVVDMELMLQRYEKRDIIPVGIDRTDVKTSYVDLTKFLAMAVIGNPNAGKSQLLLNIAKMIGTRFSETQFYVFDSDNTSLKDMKADAVAYAGGKDDPAVTDAVSKLIATLTERKQLKDEAAKQDAKDPTDDLPMICILVDDLVEFVTDISDANRDAMARICRLSKGYGLIFLCAARVSDVIKAGFDPLVKTVIDCQNGLAVDGTPKQHIFYNNDLAYNERDKELESGSGYLYYQGSCKAVKYMK